MISSTRWLSSALILAIGVSSVTALAAPAVPPEVKEKVKEAQKAYDLSDFTTSLKLFSEAYELKPLPGILFNIAQCQRQLGNYERAGFFYRRYLSLSPKRPKNAAEVQRLIKEVDAAQAEQERKQREQEEAERQKRELELARLAADGKLPPAQPRQATTTPPPSTETPKESPPPMVGAPIAQAPLTPREVEGGAPMAVQPYPAVETHAESDSILHKWWLWAGIGAAVLAGSAVTYAVVTSSPAQQGTLQPIKVQ